MTFHNNKCHTLFIFCCWSVWTSSIVIRKHSSQVSFSSYHFPVVIIFLNLKEVTISGEDPIIWKYYKITQKWGEGPFDHSWILRDKEGKIHSTSLNSFCIICIIKKLPNFYFQPIHSGSVVLKYWLFLLVENKNYTRKGKMW